MNKYYQKYYENAVPGSRDPIFFQVLYNWFRTLNNVKILNVGSERSLDLGSRAGDGWANFYWAEFVKINGGKLVIVDIDPKAIEISKTILEDFTEIIDINFVVGSGLDALNQEEYDFVYLDGPDDNQFTLDCMNKINLDKCSVLIDDSNRGGKADLVRNDYPNYWLFPCNYIHELIFYPSKNLQNKVLNG